MAHCRPSANPKLLGRREKSLPRLLSYHKFIHKNLNLINEVLIQISSIKRIATFPILWNTDINNETVSEIVSATKDGRTLVYTDSELEKIGFVDISNPYEPEPDGVVALPGEPTSVTVVGKFALACVNTSEDFINTGGQLVVIDIDSREIVREIDLGGQPDAIAASPNGRYAAIAIENERDEDLEPSDVVYIQDTGYPPQLPAGFLVIVDLKGKNPDNWETRDVDLTGISDKFPEDPEPEFVDINSRNIAAVSLQENNHIVLVRLSNGKVIGDFSAGTVDLDNVDIEENDLIELKDSLFDVPREPDALTWIGKNYIGTADEGDLDGGSRGFTIFSKSGRVVFTSGNNDDHLQGLIGYYPEDRSENKGNEPEGIEYGKYGKDELLFVGSERSSIISVYKLGGRRGNDPQFLQTLPARIAPEGLLAIPNRNLLVVAGEADARDDKFRSTISIYKRNSREPTYPTIASEDRPDGTPIPWAALSALAAQPEDGDRLWTVYDSFYKQSRIFEIDNEGSPALITGEIVLRDTFGAFADAIVDANGDFADAITSDLGPEFVDISADNLINSDGSINVDPEGLALSEDGYFWLASEGSRTVGETRDNGDPRPVEKLNWLFKVNSKGDILEVVSMPLETNLKQVRFGFEGVTSVGSGDSEILYVCIQREWDKDPLIDNHVRIGRYDTFTGAWSFFLYPIAEPTSPNGGWVGLSEIVAISDTEFLVIERDNQAGLDAAIKKVYAFTIDGIDPQDEATLTANIESGDASTLPIVSKELIKDLIPDLLSDNGVVIEKVEGLAVAGGDMYIVTENDGVDDSSGETQFLNVGPLE